MGKFDVVREIRNFSGEVMTKVRCIKIADMNNTLGLVIRGENREKYSRRMEEQAQSFHGRQNETFRNHRH